MWVEHYLHRRSPQRAKALVGSLPFSSALASDSAAASSHPLLTQCIIDDRDPQVVEKPRNRMPIIARMLIRMKNPILAVRRQEIVDQERITSVRERRVWSVQSWPHCECATR